MNEVGFNEVDVKNKVIDNLYLQQVEAFYLERSLK